MESIKLYAELFQQLESNFGMRWFVGNINLIIETYMELEENLN